MSGPDGVLLASVARTLIEEAVHISSRPLAALLVGDKFDFRLVSVSA